MELGAACFNLTQGCCSLYCSETSECKQPIDFVLRWGMKTKTVDIGSRFGSLVVVRRYGKNNRGESLYSCQCNCGKRKRIKAYALTSGHTTSCGCKPTGPKRIDIVGMIFGRLTVEAYAGGDSHRGTLWLCCCLCGNKVTVRKGALLSGRTKSCGCYSMELKRRRGAANPLYRAELHAFRYCACGCGALTALGKNFRYNKYVRGHKLPTNKGTGYKGPCAVCGINTEAAHFGSRWARKTCPRCYSRERARYYRKIDPERFNSVAREQRRKLREYVIAALGGHCTCCKEPRYEFLTLDHIHGGGSKHVASLGSTTRVWQEVKKRGCPKSEFRILCWNCNMAVSIYGKCPHGGAVGPNPRAKPILERKCLSSTSR